MAAAWFPPLRNHCTLNTAVRVVTQDETSSKRSKPFETGEHGKRGVGANHRSRTSERFRKQNVVTNASTFGDIGYTAMDDTEMAQRSIVIPVEPDVVDNPTIREALCGPYA